MKAIITGDIINSSRYNKEGRDEILNTLLKIIDKLEHRDQCDYSIFRGDSVQGLLYEPQKALRHALFLKSSLKALKISSFNGSKRDLVKHKKIRSSETDIRISIGIGEVNYMRDRLEESDGEAFRYSGQELDKMKSTGKGIILKSSFPVFDNEWKVILALMDEVINKWSVSSAELVLGKLEGLSDIALSKKLNISRAAISLRKKYAGWESIKKALEYYEEMTANDLTLYQKQAYGNSH